MASISSSSSSSSSSIWRVPEPIKAVFDTFPLKTYSANKKSDLTLFPQNTTNKFELIKKDQDQSQFSSQGNFQLGVYNVSKYVKDPNVLIPTDPICLSTLLIINLRNGLLLPKVKFPEGDNGNIKNNNFITILSYHASYDGELPLLIEDNSGKNLQKSIKSTSLINDLNLTRCTDNKEFFKCQVVDSILYDCWVITVLYELSDLQKLKIYTDLLNDKENSMVLDTLTLNDLLASTLITRFSFNIRNENLASYWSNNNLIKNLVYRRSLLAKIEMEKNSIFRKTLEILEIFEQELAKSNFFLEENNKELPSILDCKIAGLVYCILQWCEGSKLYAMINTLPNLKSHCYRCIDKCI
ncbi:hypothetical protein PACTADRAFT_35671 [Pachysolen tannophilus NRRL Y-2460]|uniref:Mitochondrial outer membrane transport complex Sam37/metaxin N-terminal domain-containing protein n=1 Tax=Pachysolen tannophilus NRRL Y-2460 TaxID=669874 RepID=A0A1E4TQ90_PACTA|nr:hypothetical protein PACTADRAFT_35671 [Pachysolen tannophilus NRRL Y-2460]